MEKDGGDDGRVGEEGEDGHLATTSGAEEGKHLVDPGEEHGPADPSGAGAPRRFGIGRCALGFGGWGRRQLRPADGDGGRSGSCVGGEHAMVSVAVHPGRGNEPGDALEELEGREQDLGASVGRGPREAIEEPGLGRGE